jgi:hypothetical protein
MRRARDADTSGNFCRTNGKAYTRARLTMNSVPNRPSTEMDKSRDISGGTGPRGRARGLLWFADQICKGSTFTSPPDQISP